MYLEKLSLINYRNYEGLEIRFSAQINIFRGLNAQGKTNLLESIYYLSTGKSYRPAKDAQLVKWHCDYFKINGDVRNKTGMTNIAISYSANPQALKEMRVNGIRIAKTADLLGKLTSVLFAPEDLNIIKGAPAERRRLLDNDISQVSPFYHSKINRYNRILSQRNTFFKKKATGKRDNDELEIWDQQLANVGSEIINKRLEALEKLTPLARLMQRRLTDGEENIELRYIINKEHEIKKGEPISEILLNQAKKHRAEEMRRGITLWGPHRDDLDIYINGVNLKYFGSQGQHRTAVLALKLAELEFFRAESGEYPILLLDDVLSELDSLRRECLLSTIQEKDIQCFITATENIPSFKKQDISLQRFCINQGKLTSD